MKNLFSIKFKTEASKEISLKSYLRHLKNCNYELFKVNKPKKVETVELNKSAIKKGILLYEYKTKYSFFVEFGVIVLFEDNTLKMYQRNDKNIKTIKE